MLSKSRCPYTGVVNFFTDTDPKLSVGSVARTGAKVGYVWRCYVGSESSGAATDMSLAETRLRRAIARGDDWERQPRRVEPACPSHASGYWQKLNSAPSYEA